MTLLFTNAIKPVAVAVSAAVLMTGSMFSIGAAQAQEIAPMAAAQTQQLPDFVQLVEKYGKGVVNIPLSAKPASLKAQAPLTDWTNDTPIFRRFGFPMLPFMGPREEPDAAARARASSSAPTA